MDIRDTEKQAFQAFLDSLQGEFGCIYRVTFPDEFFVRRYLAGMRVLEATPLFDRATGEVQSWRYLIYFAEMALLDTTGSGHPEHAFECEVEYRDAGNVTFAEQEAGYSILVSKNDPHEFSESQAAVYRDWDASVERFGGKEKLQAVIDAQAAAWLERVVALREDAA
ncbi:MAG: hypothetical protein WC326_08180 [Candidatus Delongbacteria bacterium]